MTQADAILQRLEKLRGQRYAAIETPDGMPDIPVIIRTDLDAAIEDIRKLLSEPVTTVRADDRWRALLAEMRSYNSFEARCADRIESLLAEPVTVWHPVTSPPDNARDVLLRLRYTEGDSRNIVIWWNGSHWVGDLKGKTPTHWCELPNPPAGEGGGGE